MTSDPAQLSLLDLVKATDNVPYPEDPEHLEIKSSAYRFLSHAEDLALPQVDLGLIVPAVAKVLKDLFADAGIFVFDEAKLTVSISKSLDTFDKRNEAIAKVARTLKDQGYFKPVLDGWRNELYVVFNPSKVPYLLVERAASPLFGVITYGVHITGYVPASPTSSGMRLWVPRRSYQKPTFPGMLDNTVAGGLGYPYGIYDTAIKECGEEAGLEEDYVKQRLTSVGVITYWYRHKYSDDLNLFQPECEYIYDLKIDEDTVPHPVDGEVAEFNLWNREQLDKELKAGNFKPNSALVFIDFFVRHGLLGPEDEPDYLNIVSRTHRRFPYPAR